MEAWERLQRENKYLVQCVNVICQDSSLIPLCIDNVGALIRMNYLRLYLIISDKLYEFGYLTANTSAISLINRSNLLLLKLVDTETLIRYQKTL